MASIVGHERVARVEPLSLDKAAKHLLEECRMVLPGVQALFGFQLVAVFNTGFRAALGPGEQALHLAATLCVVVAVALVMAPAALHRMREPKSVSDSFIRISTQLLMWSMVPLAVGTTLDVYLVARVLTNVRWIALASAAFSLAIFSGLWVILPTRVRLN